MDVLIILLLAAALYVVLQVSGGKKTATVIGELGGTAFLLWLLWETFHK